jgi:hypothetical protein
LEGPVPFFLYARPTQDALAFIQQKFPILHAVMQQFALFFRCYTARLTTIRSLPYENGHRHHQAFQTR